MVKAIEAHTSFHDESRLDGADPIENGVISVEIGRASEGILISEADGSADSWKRYRGEGGRSSSNSILTRIATEDCIPIIPIPVGAKIALIPSLFFTRVGYVVVDQAGSLCQWVGIDQLRRH